MSKLRKLIRNPWVVIAYLGARGFLRWIPDAPYLKLLYRARTGSKLSLKSPTSFNEKVQWLKLYDRNPIYTQLVDKVRAKEIAAEVLGPDAVVPTLGVWGDAEDIDFESLPNEFVLKTNHNSGGIIICRDKRSFDSVNAIEFLNAKLRQSYYWPTREWPYKDVQPLVFAEQYLPDSYDEDSGPGALRGVIDYKFYCFHGEPRFLYVSQGMEDHSTARVMFLSLDWSALEFGRSDYANFEEPPAKPATFDRMVGAARELARGIPFVRVDLFEHLGKVLFSEMTFHPVAGMMPFVPADADEHVGTFLDLAQVAATR